MDILKYINGLGTEHREALQKVHQELHRLGRLYHIFNVGYTEGMKEMLEHGHCDDDDWWCDDGYDFCECQFKRNWEKNYDIKFNEVLYDLFWNIEYDYGRNYSRNYGRQICAFK